MVIYMRGFEFVFLSDTVTPHEEFNSTFERRENFFYIIFSMFSISSTFELHLERGYEKE